VAPFLTTSSAARLRRSALRAPFDALATRLAVGRSDPAIRAILAEIGASAGAAYADAARWTIHRARSTTSGSCRRTSITRLALPAAPFTVEDVYANDSSGV